MDDPYAFTEEEYEDTGVGVFNESFMELFRQSDSSEEEFEGFQQDDVHFGLQSRVRNFHKRRDGER